MRPVDSPSPMPDPAALLIAVLVPAATMFNEPGPWTPWDTLIAGVVLTVLVVYSWNRVSTESTGIRLATGLVYSFIFATFLAYPVQVLMSGQLARLEKTPATDVQADWAMLWSSCISVVVIAGVLRWRSQGRNSPPVVDAA